MKKILALALCVVMCIGAFAKEKAPEVTEVSVVGDGVGNGGRALLTVTVAAKKADKVTTSDLREAAVKAVIFRGWADKSNTSAFDASVNHPALCSPDTEAMRADYFKDFFASGAADSYSEIIDDTRAVMKAGKVYHVSQMVSVNVPALRKKLEKDGVIKSLKSGW